METINKIAQLLEQNQLIMTDGHGTVDGGVCTPNNVLSSYSQEELSRALLGNVEGRFHWCFVSTGPLKEGYPLPLLEVSPQHAREEEGGGASPFDYEGWFLLRDLLYQIREILQEDEPLPPKEWDAHIPF